MFRPILRAVFTGVPLLSLIHVHGQPMLEVNAGAFAWHMRFKQDDPHKDEQTADPGPGYTLGLHYREEPPNGKVGLDAGVIYAYRECGMSIGSGGHWTSNRMVADLRMNTIHMGLGLNVPLDMFGMVWFRPRMMAGLAQWTIGSGYIESQGQGGQVSQLFEERHFKQFHSGLRASMGLGFKIGSGGPRFLDIEPYYSRGLTNECDLGDANFRHDELGLRIGVCVALRGWRNFGQLPMPQD